MQKGRAEAASGQGAEEKKTPTEKELPTIPLESAKEGAIAPKNQ